jgi:two-component system, OmpR family, sensor kinase
MSTRPSLRLSAGARVALAVMVSILLSTVLLAGISYVVVARHLALDLDQSLFREAEAYKAAVGDAAQRGTRSLVEASEAYVQGRSAESGVALLLRLPDDRMVSGAPAAVTGTIRRETEDRVESAAASFEDVTIEGEDYRVATVPIPDEQGQNVAVFQAAVSMSAMELRLSTLAQRLIQAGLLVVIAGALASRWVAARTLRPLNRAAATAGQITDSSLSQRVPYEGPQDSVGLLVESLNRMLDRLEQAFAEQRRFVSDASHEMRTPITIVRGQLEVLREDSGLSEEHKETLDLAGEELHRMGNVIEDLLSLARLEGGALPPFGETDLAEIVEEALLGAQRLGDRRFSFHHGGPLPVLGNRDLLLQAVLNLLSNAVRYTEARGLITVSCHTRSGEAHVVVADDGPGIAPQDLERIFDRFYRSPGRQRGVGGGGSGLGLAISRRLVELHGGSLTAANGGECGAVFDLRLPISPA